VSCENRNDPDLVQTFLKKWWVESDFKAPNLPLSLWLKCKLCNTGVEDETHFLLQCPILENKRTQIINNIKNMNTNFNNLPNKSKLMLPFLISRL
jgi:hypothetical protein